MLYVNKLWTNVTEAKKDFAKKLYSEYHTEEGDEPYEPSIVTKFGGVKDTFLIVKNGE